MRTGKVSESILKRSVLKQIKSNQEKMLKGTAVGADCAFFDMDSNTIASAHASASKEGKRTASHAILRATNNLAAGGAYPQTVTLHVMLPQTWFESDLKEMMQAAKKTADLLNIAITGGHTETISELKDVVVSACAIGTPFVSPEELEKRKKTIHPGCHIVMTKWIGIGATVLLAFEKEAELLTRYPAYLIQDAKNFEQYYSVLPEAATAVKSGVCAMHDVAGGGIFGALWELGESTGVGLTISLKKIPVKQETIEICEFYDINPYEIRSDGAMLMIAEDGYALCAALQKMGIEAAVIGSVTDGNDKVIVSEDEKRFIEPPRNDELNKVID